MHYLRNSIKNVAYIKIHVNLSHNNNIQTPNVLYFHQQKYCRLKHLYLKDFVKENNRETKLTV